MDATGKIKQVINSTHPDPTQLIDQHIQSFFMDDFVETFQCSCKEVMACGQPKKFFCLICFMGRFQLRRCRIIKTSNGLLLLNYKINQVND